MKKKEEKTAKTAVKEKKVVKATKVEKPLKEEKVEEKPKVVSFDTFGINKVRILKKEKKEVNGVVYNEVKLIDGTTTLFNDKELEENLNLE